MIDLELGSKLVLACVTCASIFFLVIPANAEQVTNEPTFVCSGKPNCVSSLSKGEHYIAPLNLDFSAFKSPNRADSIIQHLKHIILAFPRVKLVEEKESYLHFQFKTKYVGFKDDVYLWVNLDHETIEWMSESRIGYSDFGANRKRLEQLRSKFAEY